MIGGRLFRISFLLSVLLVAPPSTSAEPVHLPTFTAGLRAIPNWVTGPIVFEVNGSGFVFAGESAREIHSGQELGPCYPSRCVPGGTVDFSGTTSVFGFQSYSDFQSDSQSYSISVLSLDGEVFTVPWMEGQFTVAGSVASIPQLVNGIAELTVPVNITGSLVAMISTGPFTDRPVELHLSGRGSAHMVLVRPPGVSSDWTDDVTFDFASVKNPDLVPEPTTLLLFGTGIAGVLARTRRKPTGG